MAVCVCVRVWGGVGGGGVGWKWRNTQDPEWGTQPKTSISPPLPDLNPPPPILTPHTATYINSDSFGYSVKIHDVSDPPKQPEGWPGASRIGITCDQIALKLGPNNWAVLKFTG